MSRAVVYQSSEPERAIKLEIAAQLVGDVIDGAEPIEPEMEAALINLRRTLKANASSFRGQASGRRQRSDAGATRKTESRVEVPGDDE